jgi:hypothetical protein
MNIFIFLMIKKKNYRESIWAIKKIVLPFVFHREVKALAGIFSKVFITKTLLKHPSCMTRES